MKDLIAIFIGSGLGGLLRYGIGKQIDRLHGYHFPWATLVVNILACFALGVFIGLADHKNALSPTSRLFLTVGFCGGFSTFSAFSNDTLKLIQQGYTTHSLLYVLCSVIVCLAANFCGLLIAGKL